MSHQFYFFRLRAVSISLQQHEFDGLRLISSHEPHEVYPRAILCMILYEVVARLMKLVFDKNVNKLALDVVDDE